MSQIAVSSELLNALQKLSAILDTENAFERTLNTVVDLSVSTLPGCDSAGITIMAKGEERTAAASDDFTLEIDKLQYQVNTGPCVDALHTGEELFIKSIAEETRWPEFVERAAEKGLRSSMSFPLKVNGSSGALNLYGKSDHAFDEPTAAIARIFANQADIALKNADTYAAARHLADHLNIALKSRDVIGTAKGILMEREGVSDERAFAMLTRLSQHSNVKLREIAQKLVDDKENEVKAFEA